MVRRRARGRAWGGQGRGPRVGHGGPGWALGAPQYSKGGPRHREGGVEGVSRKLGPPQAHPKLPKLCLHRKLGPPSPPEGPPKK